MDKNPSNISKENETTIQQKTNASNKITKNPDPRANENLTEKQENSSDSEGIGSEITDGEAG